MTYDELVGAVRRETDDLLGALAAGPMATPVPTCPGWDVGDLLSHVAEFTVFWTHLACDGIGVEQTPWLSMPDDETSRVEWYADLAASLVSVLSQAKAETTVWTWHDTDQTAGFVARRCAHELAIHRVDLEAAHGTQRAVDGALAVDGIDEIFDPLLTLSSPSGAASGQTMHLHATDRDGEWFVEMTAGGMEWSHEHRKGDVAVQASASDLEMLLYQRPTLGEVTTFGDEAVLAAFHREFTFGSSR